MAKDGNKIGDIYVGCAGWSISKSNRQYFPKEGTHLERYGSRFPSVEINTTFYRSHRTSTYERWADSVPEGFKFSVKIPKKISHVSRLDEPALIDEFISEVNFLGNKLGPLLLQLSPSFSFDKEKVNGFFERLREMFDGHVACEPRHKSWLTSRADNILKDFRVARVAADPPPAESAGKPGGWDGLVYYRLHGSPDMYYSAYTDEELLSTTDSLRQAAESSETWCILTTQLAVGAAIGNALSVLDYLSTV